jgi:hypothetical protein
MRQAMNVSFSVLIAVKKKLVQMSKYGLNLRPAKAKK